MNFVLAEHLIHQCPNAMNILVADLHEDRARIGQEVSRDGQTVTQVGQVGVDAVAPGIAECLHLLRLAGDVVRACRPSRRGWSSTTESWS